MICGVLVTIGVVEGLMALDSARGSVLVKMRRDMISLSWLYGCIRLTVYRF